MNTGSTRAQEAHRVRQPGHDSFQGRHKCAGLWTSVADKLSPFSICTPDGELLLLSKEKTLLFCVPTRKRTEASLLPV